MAVHPKCCIIGIIGGKGGVGKSVFAANFASAAVMDRQKTLLIDLDSKSCGDQNVITGLLRPVMTLSELTQFTGSINTDTLSKIVTPHGSGLGFLSAVKSPTDVIIAAPDMAIRQIEALSPFYSIMVIDLGSDITDLQRAAIDICTSVFMVTTPEILAVTQTSRLVKELSIQNFPSEATFVIMNKALSSTLKPQEIERRLERKVIGLIPQDDATAQTSVSRGQMFVVTQPTAAISAAHIDAYRRFSPQIARIQALQKAKPPSARTPAIMPSTSNAPGGALGRMQQQSGRSIDPVIQMRIRIHDALVKELDLTKGLANTQGDPIKEAKLRQETQEKIAHIIDRDFPELPRAERSGIASDVLNEALALGPLEALLADETISEIMVNGPYRIFIEKSGKIQLSNFSFTSNLHLRNVIIRIVSTMNRQINESSPYVDARLKDGSRVNAVIEPIAIDGPALTIRKFRKNPITPQQYIDWGTLTQPMTDFLRICVENGMNIIVSGGTGSGKTTLLNVLSSFIPATERIVTVEDAAELQLRQEHVVRLETKPANMEGSGEVSIRDLVRNALRMRPDRIIVGECRGGEALDMLSAMNTGHDGSMTTVHANNPKEAIRRIETLCMMAGLNLPSIAIREQVTQAVHMIIQISRLNDGSRRVTDITQVVGMQEDVPTLGQIFRFEQRSIDKNKKIVGEFVATGFMPTFLPKLKERGINIPPELFKDPGKIAAARAAAPSPTGLSGQSAGQNNGQPNGANPRAIGQAATSVSTMNKAPNHTSNHTVANQSTGVNPDLKKVGGGGTR